MKYVLCAGDLAESKRGARVAVIDSGVHAAHPHVQGVAGGIGVTADGGLDDDYVDRLGHGTAVVAVIREKAPAADVFCIKVFDRELKTTADALVSALRWARSQQVHLINLSLGTANPAHEAALAEEVASASAGGIVIVSAAPQPDSRWLPGALQGVVAVESDFTMSRDACEVTITPDGRRMATASGYPRPVPNVPVERNLKGVSFAVANVTGLLARAWPHWPQGL